MRNFIEKHPERTSEIREIAISEGFNLSGDIKDDWHCLLGCDMENADDPTARDWEDIVRNYCREMHANRA